MAGLGLIRVLERVARARGPALLVLIYHRIAEPQGDPYYEPVISASPQTFHEQMQMIRKHYRVLCLDEIPRDGSPIGFSITKPSVLITFDDGYRDNAEVAAPILQELEIPATFFLTTDFVEGVRLPWWDQVSYVIKRTTKQSISLDMNEHCQGNRSSAVPLRIDLGNGSPLARTLAIKLIIGAFLEGRILDETRFLSQLGERADVTVEVGRLGRDLFMTWDQARSLAGCRYLFSIGSHTVSHHKLAALSEAEQRAELARSRQTLEAMLGQEIDSLAYPYGGIGAFDLITERIAAEAGYRLAFSALEATNRHGALLPFQIGRLMIGSGDTASLLRARLALRSAIGRSFL